jgi:hypothetical protein
MSRLINPIEKILKKAIKKGIVEVLNETEYDEVWDKVEQDMEDYRINENYRKGMSRIEIEKTPTLHDYFLSITPKITI